jgi:hypothetical protein
LNDIGMGGSHDAACICRKGRHSNWCQSLASPRLLSGPATEDALNSIAAEMKIGRTDLIRIVLREWLETNAYLPMRKIDEESETDGRG